MAPPAHLFNMARVVPIEVKVRMLADAQGSINGYDVKTYVKDLEYVLPRALAEAFLGTGEAKEVKEEKR